MICNTLPQAVPHCCRIFGTAVLSTGRSPVSGNNPRIRHSRRAIRAPCQHHAPPLGVQCIDRSRLRCALVSTHSSVSWLEARRKHRCYCRARLHATRLPLRPSPPLISTMPPTCRSCCSAPRSCFHGYVAHSSQSTARDAVHSFHRVLPCRTYLSECGHYCGRVLQPGTVWAE